MKIKLLLVLFVKNILSKFAQNYYIKKNQINWHYFKRNFKLLHFHYCINIVSVYILKKVNIIFQI